MYHPDALYQLYRERDEEGYVQCCLLSDKCDVFYRRRPSQDCTGYVFRPFTWGFGDPHVISMDGFMYTFNGIGQFSCIILDTRTYNFLQFQLRTCLNRRILVLVPSWTV